MFRVFLIAFLVLTSQARAEPLLVFAAASLGGALDEAAAGFEGDVVISYAGSSALARQVVAGAPADILILANTFWMDGLEDAGHIDADTRQDLLGNELVVVTRNAPDALLPVAEALSGDGRIATGFLEAVPVGIYARQSLVSLGLFQQVSDRLVQTENVRIALRLAARGDVAAAITYRTDALAEPAVGVAAVFPLDSHDPIRYPVAATRRSVHPDRAAFLEHLLSPATEEVFVAHGFEVLP